MSVWKPMICSWYVHVGFNKRAISFNNTQLDQNGECDGALTAYCCSYELSLHTYTTTNIFLSIYSLNGSLNAQNHWDNCILVKRQFILLRILPFLEASSRVKQSFSNHLLPLYCFWMRYDWLLQVSLGEVTIQGQHCRFASDDEKMAPAACRIESHDKKSIINLTNKISLNFPHRYTEIKWKRVKGFKISRNRSNRLHSDVVVVKAKTKSTNHSNFQTDRSISTILFSVQLRNKYSTWSCDLIVENELKIAWYRRLKRHCRCVGVLKLARAETIWTLRSIWKCRFYRHILIHVVNDH